jgi:hypothetical protein
MAVWLQWKRGLSERGSSSEIRYWKIGGFGHLLPLLLSAQVAAAKQHLQAVSIAPGRPNPRYVQAMPGITLR